MAKGYHAFKCSCEGSKELPFDDFKKHLSAVHGLSSAEELKGNRQMMMHMDGAKFYSSSYKWTLNNGLEFYEFSEQPRSKKDQMYWQ
jgi:hypothetical protein